MKAYMFIAILLVSSSMAGISYDDVKENETQFKEKMEYIYVDYENTNYLMEAGKPLLKVYSKTFKFPLGTEIINVECEPLNVYEEKINKTIEPAPTPSLCINENIKIYGGIYKSKKFYPYKWYDYKTGGVIEDGKHLALLTIHLYPVRYSPVLNKIKKCNEFKVRIVYKERSMEFGDKYDFLILCPSDYKNEMERLAEHKEKHGIRTIVVTLYEIYNSHYFPCNGKDDAEKIKYFIKNAVEQWGIKYVLLVGSFNKFPMRKSWVYDENERRYWMDIPIPTDLYYADIYFSNGSFSSWDTNNNGYYGEFARMKDENFDIIDLYPDIYVGRIACENLNEVKNLVDKIIEYENNAYGKRWFHKVICIAGDTVPNDGYGDVDEGIVITESSLKYLQGFKAIKLYPSVIIPELKLNTMTIHTAISLGAGFVHFDGHGNMVAWSTHPHNDDKWIGNYGNDMVDYLINGYKLPVIRIGGCFCGALDYEKESCFAWTFLKNRRGGAIASIAATRLSYGYIGRYCDAGLEGYHGILFFKGYKEGCTPAEMLAFAQKEYMNRIPMKYEKEYLYDFKTIEEFILFGDPTLKIGGYPNGT